MTRMPDRSSARSPTTAAMRARVWRKATLARRVKSTVANSINGSTPRTSSASRGLIDTITATMPPSSRVSPMSVISPCDRSSLITATSLITQEMVTPAMWVS